MTRSEKKLGIVPKERLDLSTRAFPSPDFSQLNKPKVDSHESHLKMLKGGHSHCRRYCFHSERSICAVMLLTA